MEEIIRLRAQAARCFRLARWINSPEDSIRLEAMGAAAERAVAVMEAARIEEKANRAASHEASSTFAAHPSAAMSPEFR
jgi:hypothetical protein